MSFAALRPRFPIFAERLYLATQCMGPVLTETYDDMKEYVASFALRSRALPGYVQRFEEMFVLCEQLLAAPSGSVALKDSATSCHAAIAAALHPSGRKRRIITSGDDFHSTRYLWHAQRLRGFEVMEVPSGAGGLGTMIDESVVAVAVSLVSPKTGALLDVAPIVAAARKAGALVILDAYQAVGAVPVRVAELDADVIVGGTHKWLSGGGTGLAFMYVRPELAESIEPTYPGWVGDASYTSFTPGYAPAAGARRFMQGTPAFEALFSGRAGLRYVLEAGIDNIRARSQDLTAALLAHLGDRVNVRTPRSPDRRGGTLCIEVPGDMPGIVEKLAERGIDIDFRPGAGLRMSPHPVMTLEEVKHVADQLLSLL